MRRFPSKGYNRWRKEARVLLMASRLRPIKEPCVITLELTPKDCRPRDADNYAKAILDLLVEGRILPDDSNRWVKAVIPYWENPSPASGVRVTIRAAKKVRREALTPNEHKALARIKRAGIFTHRPGYSSNAIRGLLEKGYVQQLPGLLEGVAQGLQAID